MSTDSYRPGARQRDGPETPRTVRAPTHPPTAQAPQYIRLGVRSRTSRLSHTWARRIRKRRRNPAQFSREERDALQALGMRMRWTGPAGGAPHVVAGRQRRGALGRRRPLPETGAVRRFYRDHHGLSVRRCARTAAM